MTDNPPTTGTGRPTSSEGLAWVREALRARCGLRSDEVTDVTLERSVRQAAKAAGSSFEDLVAHVREPATDGGLALQHLLRRVTVGETTFFRHVEDLDWLRGVALPALIAKREREGAKRLRFWSAGCATGEEAYTLAILALEAVGDRDWEIQVLGSDINDESLQGARNAAYGEWSFRGVPPALRERWFERIPGRNEEPAWRPLPKVRGLVEFEYLNLRDPIYPSIFTRTTELDLVLCRNVFLYFFADTARTCLQRFAQCVVDDGYVLCGPADLFHLAASDVPELVPDKTWPNRLRRGVFAAESKTPRVPAARVIRAPVRTFAPPTESTRSESTRATPLVKTPPPAAAAETTASVVAKLSAGDYTTAEAEARAALARDPLSLEFARCLALAMTASDESRAVDAWRKVLYLDPLDPGAHFGLGMALLRLGRRPDARAHFKTVVKFLAGRDASETIAGPDALPVGWLRSACRSLAEGPTGPGDGS